MVNAKVDEQDRRWLYSTNNNLIGFKLCIYVNDELVIISNFVIQWLPFFLELDK
jgi:hypothetical protein